MGKFVVLNARGNVVGFEFSKKAAMRDRKRLAKKFKRKFIVEKA